MPFDPLLVMLHVSLLSIFGNVYIHVYIAIHNTVLYDFLCYIFKSPVRRNCYAISGLVLARVRVGQDEGKWVPWKHPSNPDSLCD